jgi:hypothetical protein
LSIKGFLIECGDVRKGVGQAQGLANCRHHHEAADTDQVFTVAGAKA